MTAEGMELKQIAEKLGVSLSTATNCRRSVFLKLRVVNPVQATLWYQQFTKTTVDSPQEVPLNQEQ
jgi:DNA-binding CsgD family transcriptional regulator